jgi:hypothetical protein
LSYRLQAIAPKPHGPGKVPRLLTAFCRPAAGLQAGVRTFSVRLGVHRVYWVCIALLEAAYLGAIVASLGSSAAWSRAASAAAHAVLAAALLWRASRTDLSSSKSIYSCYMDVWKLLYLEYLLLPLFR